MSREQKYRIATLEDWAERRQRCRTDLHYLCTEVLGYKDVSLDVHGQLLDSLQKFKGGKDELDFERGAWLRYTPWCPLIKLDGSRRNLILISRGCLKTSVATIAHTIQWIINYPNIRILLSSGTGDQVKKFLAEIRDHFRYNNIFRYLFPEYCPPPGKNVKEFGTQDAFTVPCRSTHHKDPTVFTVSAESTISGGHYEVIKNDDLVDKENVKTPDQIARIKSHFGQMRPLLESVEHHWIDLIGTIYHFNDLHWSIVASQRDKNAPQHWKILLQPACENYPHGKLLWPERVSLKALRDIELDPTAGPDVLFTQYLLNPVPSSSGLVESDKELVWIPRSELSNVYPRLRLHMTVDFAGMDATVSDTDWTVLNLHGWDTDGRLYVVDVFRSRSATPDEVVNTLFDWHLKHPRLFDIKVQKDLLARVFLPTIKREEMKRNQFLPLVPIPLPNTRGYKTQSIKKLQPWFRNGTIRMAADLKDRYAIIDEIMHFPKGAHDDFLDTLAMAFSNRHGGLDADSLPTEKPLVVPDDRPYLPRDPEPFGPDDNSSHVTDMTGF